MAKLLRLHLVGGLSVNALLCTVFVAFTIGAPQIASAVTGEQTVQRVRKEVAANPSQGPTILKKRLGELSQQERTRYAAAALAAAIEAGGARDYKEYKGGRDCDYVLRLYRAAVAASPRSALALMEVAYRVCPENLVAYRDIAVQEARAAGLNDLAAAILAQADFLAAGDTRAVVVLGPLGGTINPANVGGPEGFDKEKKDVSPSE
jgi:hypothetical protein